MTRNSDIPNLLLASFKADPDAVRSGAQMSKTSLLLPIYLFSDDISCELLGYIFAQSASLYALLFVIINIYSVYSIYFGVGHFNFIQGYILYK